jgi:hypothetical protein
MEWRMASSGILHHVALVRTDISEEISASFIRVTRIGELGTTLAVTSNRRTLYFFAVCETSVHTRATQRNIPEDTILQGHRRENLKSYNGMKLPAFPWVSVGRGMYICSRMWCLLEYVHVRFTGRHQRNFSSCVASTEVFTSKWDSILEHWII